LLCLQVFIELEQGTYVSRPTVIRLGVLLESQLAKSDHLSCSVDEVSLDETVLKITLDEILSNALKNRKAGTSLTVAARLADGSLHVDVTNTNSSHAVLLTLEAREKVFLPGYKSRSRSAMSDGLGLDSVRKDIGAVNGSASIWQDKRITRVSFCLPASLPVPPSGKDSELAETSEISDTSEFSSTMPSSLSDRVERRGYSSSESLAGLELDGCDVRLPREGSTLTLEHGPLLDSAEATPLLGPSNEIPSGGEIPAPESPAGRLASPPPHDAGARTPFHEHMAAASTSVEDPILTPKCVAYAASCEQATFLREIFLELDASRCDVFSSVECRGVADVVLGRKRDDDVIDVIGPADVVVLSQQVGVEGKGGVADGAKMATEFRMLGFEGIMCLHMPGATEEELARARMHPAVDLLIPGSSKDLHLRDAAHSILSLLRHRFHLKGRAESNGGMSSTGESGSASLISALHAWSSSPELTHASASVDMPLFTGTEFIGKEFTGPEFTGPEFAGPELAPTSIDFAEPAADVNPAKIPPDAAIRRLSSRTDRLSVEEQEVASKSIGLAEPKTPPDVAAGKPSPRADAPTAAGLRVLGLDDENIPRMVQALFMKHHLQADMQISGTLGRTHEEIASFVDVAMGVLNNDLSPNTGLQRQADVVLLDQNIAPPKVLGSLLAAELRECGFTGIIVILTGASTSMIDHLSLLPAIDKVYEKGAPLPKMAGEVRELLLGL
jgi:hypothetical protein